MGIVRICIVNARDSEPQKLPGLTSTMTKEMILGDVMPWQDSWKGHRWLCNGVENAVVRLLGLCRLRGC